MGVRKQVGMRSITHDIMASPERYLDERQKMVRDKAHRNAYKIVKPYCSTKTKSTGGIVAQRSDQPPVLLRRPLARPLPDDASPTNVNRHSFHSSDGSTQISGSRPHIG